MPRTDSTQPTTLEVVDLGRIAYAPALELQRQTLERVLAGREWGAEPGGVLYLLEHDPAVITLTKKAREGAHLLATSAQLEAAGVTTHETDRGGDITYHGPGQLVVYPIVDLSRLGLTLHAYIRLLEQVVIDCCGSLGLHASRDPSATGVWVTDEPVEAPEAVEAAGGRKVCAIGVRVRRWVSMHGLALNVTTDLSHFDLIVPCGLAGRGVTSLERELGAQQPSMDAVKGLIGERFGEALGLAITRG